MPWKGAPRSQIQLKLLLVMHTRSPLSVGCGVFSSGSTTAVLVGSFERRNESWSGSVIMLHWLDAFIHEVWVTAISYTNRKNTLAKVITHSCCWRALSEMLIDEDDDYCWRFRNSYDPNCSVDQLFRLHLLFINLYGF